MESQRFAVGVEILAVDPRIDVLDHVGLLPHQRAHQDLAPGDAAELAQRLHDVGKVKQHVVAHDEIEAAIGEIDREDVAHHETRIAVAGERRPRALDVVRGRVEPGIAERRRHARSDAAIVMSAAAADVEQAVAVLGERGDPIAPPPCSTPSRASCRSPDRRTGRHTACPTCRSPMSCRHMSAPPDGCLAPLTSQPPRDPAPPEAPPACARSPPSPARGFPGLRETCGETRSSRSRRPARSASRNR